MKEEVFEYDTVNTERVLKALDESPRGATITDIADKLGLNRHTVTKILERCLIEKRVNYDEKGPAKIFYSTGKSRYLGKIDQGKWDRLWINVFEPKYPGEEEFIRINQTKHDNLIRSSSKFRSVGAIAIKKSSLIDLIRMLRDIAREEFKLKV